MNLLTIIIDDWGHKELKDYLMFLKGIIDVEIKSEEVLEISIKYDVHLITPKIIKLEILLFLDILKMPALLAFDKHPNFKTLNYTITRESICCEYCFKGSIEELFEMQGIEKVESNYLEEYLLKRNGKHENIIINIQYNPDILNIEDMKRIELNLNL